MDYGSAEWFVIAKANVYQQTFALAHLQSALEAADRLLGDFANLDQIISSALIRTAVIEYGKLYTPSRGSKTYPFSSIKNKSGVDRAVHDEILTLRHKLIAHQDDDFADKILLTFSVTTQKDGVTAHFPMGTQFRGLLLHAINSKDLLSKIVAHIRASHSAVAENAKEMMEIYREAAAQNHDNFVEYSLDAKYSKRSPILTSDGVKASEIKMDVRANLDLPNLVNKGDYSYKIFAVNYAKQGSVSVKDSSGAIQTLDGAEIKFS